MERALYLMITPLIFAANLAAAVGDVVRDFPAEFRATWRYLGGSPTALFPLPDEYEFLRFDPRVVDVCGPCKGSGFAPGRG
jgi:hypothetical protein